MHKYASSAADRMLVRATNSAPVDGLRVTVFVFNHNENLSRKHRRKELASDTDARASSDPFAANDSRIR